MATPVDDLRQGQWVAMIELKKAEGEDPPNISFQTPGMVMLQARQIPGISHPHPRVDKDMYEVDGRPFQIMAVSLPFVVLYCPLNRHMFPVDIRLVDFQVLDRTYVQVFTEGTLRESGSLAPGKLPSNIFRGGERDEEEGEV